MNILYSFPNSIMSIVGVLVVLGVVMTMGVYVRPRLTRESAKKEGENIHELPEKVCLGIIW